MAGVPIIGRTSRSFYFTSSKTNSISRTQCNGSTTRVRQGVTSISVRVCVIRVCVVGIDIFFYWSLLRIELRSIKDGLSPKLDIYFCSCLTNLTNTTTFTQHHVLYKHIYIYFCGCKDIFCSCLTKK